MYISIYMQVEVKDRIKPFLSLVEVNDCPSEVNDCLLMAAVESMDFLDEKVSGTNSIELNIAVKMGKLHVVALQERAGVFDKLSEQDLSHVRKLLSCVMYNHVHDASLRKGDCIVVPLDDLLQWDVWPQFLKICRKCTVCVFLIHQLMHIYYKWARSLLTYTISAEIIVATNILQVKFFVGRNFVGEVSP